MKQYVIALLMVLLCGAAIAQSGEEQAARQARSVHLQYQGWEGKAKIFYIEITPLQMAPGTYFCALAFDGGYCGLQLLPDNQHCAIFSVWEPSDPFDFAAHPDAVDESKRAKDLYHGECVDVQRFGGEGTGLRSMLGVNWQLDLPIQMAVSVMRVGKYRTAYTCWIWDFTRDEWFRVATFSTLVNNGKAELRYPYSFLEDFLRNVKSRDWVRRGKVSRLWAWNGEAWSPCKRAIFTADQNTLTTIDAGATDTGFWLATGGETENVTTKLWNEIRPGEAPDASETRRAKLLEAVRAIETAEAAPAASPAKPPKAKRKPSLKPSQKPAKK